LKVRITAGGLIRPHGCRIGPTRAAQTFPPQLRKRCMIRCLRKVNTLVIQTLHCGNYILAPPDVEIPNWDPILP
jgi:hypothetical protein